MFSSETTLPRRRLIDAHAESARQIDHAMIALYGLPTGWSGLRSTGATCFETGVARTADGVTTEVHETVELVHEDGESCLQVESSDHPLSIEDGALLDLLGSDGTCTSLTVWVEGRAEAFASVQTDAAFVARWAGPASTVTVRGDHWPMASGLQLVRITDMTPYHRGRLRKLEQRSGFSLGG